MFLGTRGNQSLRGVLTRLAGSVTSATAGWIAAAVLVVIAGLLTAAVLYRAGAPGARDAGLRANRPAGLPAELGSSLGLGGARHRVAGSSGAQAKGPVRAAWWVAAGGLLVVFGAWPQFWDASAGLTPAGLVWYGPATYFATGDKPWYHEFHWHGLQLLAGNIFVLAGLIALAALATAALRLWSGRPGTQGPGRCSRER